MKGSGSYVLWLPSWYPNELEPYNGDFIQRHAKAAALYMRIEVLHVIKDEEGRITKDVLTRVKEDGLLRETIIYYYQPSSNARLFNKYKSWKKYSTLYKNKIRELFMMEGKPKLVNVYIALKAGLVARWIRKEFRVDYVVSEQWTIYLKEARPNFSSLSPYFQYLCKKIFADAEDVMAVSKYLGSALQNRFDISEPTVIPNVVDNEIFNYDQRKRKFENRFIHISTLVFQKNFNDILRAFQIVDQRGFNFSLDVIGPNIESLTSLVKACHLQEKITFHGEMGQAALSEYIKRADALILYSRYETFGCVLIEANSCGVPVIVSDIPVMHENVTNRINGLFVKQTNPEALAEIIISFLHKKYAFNARQIAKYASDHYSYQSVGLRFWRWYVSLEK